MQSYPTAGFNGSGLPDTAATTRSNGPGGPVPSALFFRVDRNLQTLLQVCQEQLWLTSAKKRAINESWDGTIDGRDASGLRKPKRFFSRHQTLLNQRADGWAKRQPPRSASRNDREFGWGPSSLKALDHVEDSSNGTARPGSSNGIPVTVWQENMTFYRELSAAIDVALAQSHWESSAEDTALFLEDALREAFQLGCTFEGRPELKYLSEAVVTQVAEKLRILSRACFYQEWSPPHDLLLCGQRTGSAEMPSQQNDVLEGIHNDEAEAVDRLAHHDEEACDKCPRFGVTEGSVDYSCPCSTDNRASPRSVFSFCPQSATYEECRALAQPETEGSSKGATTAMSRVVIVHAETGDLKEIQLQNKDALLCILGKADVGQQQQRDQVVQRIYRALSHTKGCQKRTESGDKGNVEKEWRRLFTDCSSQDSSSMLKVPMADVLYRAGTTSQSPALLSARSSSFDESTMEWDDGEFLPPTTYGQSKANGDDQGHGPDGLSPLGSMGRSSFDTRPAFFSSLSAASTQCPGSPPQRYASIEMPVRLGEQVARAEDNIDRSSNLKPQTFLKNTPRVFEKERRAREALEKCDKGLVVEAGRSDGRLNEETVIVHQQTAISSKTAGASLVGVSTLGSKTTRKNCNVEEEAGKEMPLEMTPGQRMPSAASGEQPMETSLIQHQDHVAATVKKSKGCSTIRRQAPKAQLWAKDAQLYHQTKESFREEEPHPVGRGLNKERAAETLKGLRKENNSARDAFLNTVHIDAKAGDALHIPRKPRSFLEDSKSQHMTLDMLQKVMKKRLQESERYAVVTLGNKDPRCTDNSDAPLMH